MTSAPFDELSAYQRECLRRTFNHQTSKEIALALGKSKYAIDQTIERAVRKLGLNSRKEASQALARHESASDQIGCDAAYLSPVRSEHASPMSPPSEVATLGDESATPHGGEGFVNHRDAFRWPVRRKGELANDLTIAQRAAWLVLLPIAMAIGFGMLTSGAKVFADLVLAIAHRK